MNEFLQLLSNIALYLNFSVIFSIMLLCVIFYLKTKDKTISFFLSVLFFQVLVFSIGLLYEYVRYTDLSHLFERYSENLAFLAVILICFIMTAMLYMTVRYLLYLIPLEEKRKRLGTFLTVIVASLYLLFSLFMVIWRTEDQWAVNAQQNLRFMFLLGSVILVAPAIVAFIYNKKASQENQGLLRGIICSFLPVAVYFPVDLLFLQNSSFQITHIAYTVFALHLFMHIMKKYLIEYETQSKPNQEKIQQFNKKYGISEREAQIIECLVTGQSNKDISAKLYISVNTLKSHIKNIYRKLHVSNRIQLIYKIRTESEEK